MNDENQNQPSESQLEVLQRLTEDLQALYDPPEAIPFEIDRAIIDQARRHFNQGRSARHIQMRLVFRWAAAVAATAAAVIVVAFMMNPARELGNRSIKDAPMASAEFSLQKDLDQNGRVDILDAFFLARRIEAAGELVPQWDFNGDGAINQADVDTVAQAAVRLRKEVL